MVRNIKSCTRKLQQMFDLFTFIFYPGLLAFLIISTRTYQLKPVYLEEISFESRKRLSVPNILGLIIFALLIGFRYDVGTDWMAYKDLFTDLSGRTYLTFQDQKIEIGYYLLSKFFVNQNLGHQYLFFSMALLSWYFVYKGYPSHILYLGLYFLFVDEFFFWSMNGMRQFLAIAIWFYSLKYVISRKIGYYILYILLASCFHKSVIFMLLVYFLPNLRLYNRKIWLIIFLASLLIGSNSFVISKLTSAVVLVLTKLPIAVDYINYVDTDRLTTAQVNLGLGFFYKIIVNVSIIYFSKFLLEKNSKLNIYILLFFVGTVIFNIFYNVQLVGRINQYFLFLRSFLMAVICYHFIKEQRFTKWTFFIIVSYFFLFLVAIYNGSNLSNPFRFDL